MSSYQLEKTASFAPHVAVHLNLTADHLDRYPSLAAYGADEPLYRGIIASNADMLRAGVDPGGIVAETVAELRRCGWAG